MPSLSPPDVSTCAPTLQVALKCSDLGHLTSSIEVHKQWVARLEEVSAFRSAISRHCPPALNLVWIDGVRNAFAFHYIPHTKAPYFS